MDERHKLSSSEIADLIDELPALPADYIAHLREVGWGKTESGHMVYSGPIYPDEVYPHLTSENQRVILGDDFHGFCIGYDFQSKTYGEFSDKGDWSSFPGDFVFASVLHRSI